MRIMEVAFALAFLVMAVGAGYGGFYTYWNMPDLGLLKIAVLFGSAALVIILLGASLQMANWAAKPVE